MPYSWSWLGLRLGLALFLALAGVAPLHAQEVSQRFHGLDLHARLLLGDETALADTVIVIPQQARERRHEEFVEELQNAFREYGISSLLIRSAFARGTDRGGKLCEDLPARRPPSGPSPLAAWLDWLKGRGYQHVVLLAYGEDSNRLVRQLAVQKTDMLMAVVLVAPPTWDSQTRLTTERRDFDAPLAPQLARAQTLVALGEGRTPMDIRARACPGRAVTAETIIAYQREQEARDTPALLPRLATRVLVLVGSQDPVLETLAPEMEALAEHSPQIQFQIVDGADHAFRNLYRYEVVERVKTFLGTG